ncbi:MAG: peptide ABC transporter permease [Acidobacteria bacterium]|nr:MAG: peptide ABC transporter permease [Acidobacteriota bacterium]
MRILRYGARGFISILILLSICMPMLIPVNPMSRKSNGRETVSVEGQLTTNSRNASLFPILHISPFRIDSGASLKPPSGRHLLGTDILGRDILARMLLGGQVSFFIGFLATVISLLIGIPAGALAGFSGGWPDRIFNRFVELFYAIPMLLLLILISGTMELSIASLAIILGVFGWIVPARYMRGEVMKLREMNYVQYAVATGASRWHIIRTHLIPNGIGPVLVSASFNMANLILIEATLSFLGLGVRPPFPSWGRMVYEGLGFLNVAPWIYVPPMVMLFLSIFSYDILGQDLKRMIHSR